MKQKSPMSFITSSLAALGLLLAPVMITPAPAQYYDGEYYEDTYDNTYGYNYDVGTGVEWDPNEGYHEEEWYDPSDWFNDDSTVDYEYDYWSPYGYDSAYDTNYTQTGYDPYDYNYGYDDGYDTTYDYYTDDWYEYDDDYDWWDGWM